MGRRPCSLLPIYGASSIVVAVASGAVSVRAQDRHKRAGRGKGKCVFRGQDGDKHSDRDDDDNMHGNDTTLGACDDMHGNDTTLGGLIVSDHEDASRSDSASRIEDESEIKGASRQNWPFDPTNAAIRCDGRGRPAI